MSVLLLGLHPRHLACGWAGRPEVKLLATPPTLRAVLRGQHVWEPAALDAALRDALALAFSRAWVEPAPEACTVVLVQPFFFPPAVHEAVLRVLELNFGVAAAAAVATPVCAALAARRLTALTLQVGWDETLCVPVHHGRTIEPAWYSKPGGCLLSYGAAAHAVCGALEGAASGVAAGAGGKGSSGALPPRAPADEAAAAEVIRVATAACAAFGAPPLPRASGWEAAFTAGIAATAGSSSSSSSSSSGGGVGTFTRARDALEAALFPVLRVDDEEGNPGSCVREALLDALHTALVAATARSGDEAEAVALPLPPRLAWAVNASTASPVLSLPRHALLSPLTQPLPSPLGAAPAPSSPFAAYCRLLAAICAAYTFACIPEAPLADALASRCIAAAPIDARSALRGTKVVTSDGVWGAADAAAAAAAAFGVVEALGGSAPTPNAGEAMSDEEDSDAGVVVALEACWHGAAAVTAALASTPGRLQTGPRGALLPLPSRLLALHGRAGAVPASSSALTTLCQAYAKARRRGEHQRSVREEAAPPAPVPAAPAVAAPAPAPPPPQQPPLDMRSRFLALGSKLSKAKESKGQQ